MHPVLFEIPGLGWPIFSYGVMLGLSLIAGWYIVLGLAVKDGYSREKMSNGYIVSIAMALLCARLLYIAVNPSHFNSFGDLFNLRSGGLVAYGGFLGGVLGSLIWCRYRGVRLPAWGDSAMIAVALGLAVTRIGCFLYGCDYGRRVTDDDPGWLRAIAMRFPNWAQQYPEQPDSAAGLCSQDLHGSPAFSHHVSDYGLDPSAAESLAVVPTQLISSANAFVMFGLLVLIRRYKKFHGQVFAGFGIYYGITRFLLETIRDDTQRGTVGPAIFGPVGGFEGQLTTSQIIAVLTAAGSLALWIFLARRAKRDPEMAMFIGDGPGSQAYWDEKKEKKRGGGRPRRKGKKKSKK